MSDYTHLIHMKIWPGRAFQAWEGLDAEISSWRPQVAKEWPASSEVIDGLKLALSQAVCCFEHREEQGQEEEDLETCVA